MLKDKLYKINNITNLPRDGENNTAKKYSAELELDSAHEIFQGHFPGRPVLPGVCQVEMVRELAEEITGTKLMLTQASQIKYMNLIDPVLNPALRINIRLTEPSPGEFDVTAEINAGENTFMKMKCRLKLVHAS